MAATKGTRAMNYERTADDSRGSSAPPRSAYRNCTSSPPASLMAGYGQQATYYQPGSAMQTPYSTPQRGFYGQPPPSVGGRPPSAYYSEQRAMELEGTREQTQAMEIVQRTAIAAVRERDAAVKERDAAMRELNALRGVR